MSSSIYLIQKLRKINLITMRPCGRPTRTYMCLWEPHIEEGGWFGNFTRSTLPNHGQIIKVTQTPIRAQDDKVGSVYMLIN